jgi:CRP-like cAMP-binding protein/Fe-S-cluster-containing hydrogenase component 2
MLKQVMPRAALQPRAGDVPLAPDRLQRLSLFTSLRRPPSLDRFPGAVVLRRFHAGEVICRQGEAGWTAFYLLTSEDELDVLRARLSATTGQAAKRALVQEIVRCHRRLEALRDPTYADLRQAAHVCLTVGAPASRIPSWWGRLSGWWDAGKPSPVQRPRSIPFDGPTEIDYESRRAALHEGELFGEMSCLYHVPRSATVVAARDCYVLEILRNILDALRKDPAFRQRVDDVYRRRALGLHLRAVPLLAELTEEQFEEIRDEVELTTFEAGRVICDEGEQSDCLYVVRRGLVRVQAGVSALVRPNHVSNWAALCAALGADTWGPSLTPAARLAVGHPKPSRLPDPERDAILDALNAFIKDPALAGHEALREEAARQGAPPRDGPEGETRRFNRRLLEGALPGLRPLPPADPGTTLTYCSRGDVLGEIGVLTRQPRSATCTAFGQGVELVRLPGPVVAGLLELSPSLGCRLREAAGQRQRQGRARARARAWEGDAEPIASREAERLGLVEGRKLMLVDLHACTRCDECVHAYVKTHDDGHSRLFLDGPRFGKYLVPTTCRACRDPLCLVGCPVGSIHRGDGGQIRVEDWCIGCGLCAERCPYGAIEMHDLGIIPERSRGWRFLPAALAGERWQDPGRRDGHWVEGTAPFADGLEWQATLAARRAPAAGAVCFRHAFTLPGGPDSSSDYRLEVESAGAVRAWVNGQELDANKEHGDSRLYRPAEVLRRGHNLLAVQVTPGGGGGLILSARLDGVRRPEGAVGLGEEVAEFVVQRRAVVCDLCCDLPGGEPACVRACPHDAVRRIDARFELPVLGG